MTEMKDILSQNWVGSAIGVIGILIGIVLAFSFRTRSRIASQVNSLQLLGSNPALPKDIEFLFKGNKVPKVTLSRVAIWNVGNTTLRRDQVVAADPVRIVTPEGSTVLEARVIKRSRQVNDFSCALRQDSLNEVECQFDYLDPRDGALVELIHTGDDDVKVIGTLRGVPKMILVIGVRKSEQPKEQSTLSPTGARVMGATIMLVGFGLTVLALLFPLPNPAGLAFFSLCQQFFGAPRHGGTLLQRAYPAKPTLDTNNQSD